MAKKSFHNIHFHDYSGVKTLWGQIVLNGLLSDTYM